LRKQSRTSRANVSGCSKAAKCPPFSEQHAEPERRAEAQREQQRVERGGLDRIQRECLHPQHDPARASALWTDGRRRVKVWPVASTGPLDFLPLWLLFAGTIGVVLLSLEAGDRVGRWRAALAEPEKESSVGAMVSASLGLLAFLLAFTFGFGATRFETRRTLLIDEANAIGTAWLRARALPEPERSQARAWLREYAEARLEGARTGRLEEAIRRSTELQAKLWESAASLPERGQGTLFVSIYLQSLNEVIDLHGTRLHEGVRVRIPPIIWATLYGITVLAMAGMSYQIGLAGRRRPLAQIPFAAAFAAVMLLIADLDRFAEGSIRVSQQPLVELIASMTEAPPQ
jgi:hypothetical protein